MRWLGAALCTSLAPCTSFAVPRASLRLRRAALGCFSFHTRPTVRGCQGATRFDCQKIEKKSPSYSTASRYTHRKHNKEPSTAVRIITSSSTTKMHSPATNHTHGHAATARQLPSCQPERAHSLPYRGPIVLQTMPLLRMPEGEAPHPLPGNPCGVC